MAAVAVSVHSTEVEGGTFGNCLQDRVEPEMNDVRTEASEHRAPVLNTMPCEAPLTS